MSGLCLHYRFRSRTRTLCRHYAAGRRYPSVPLRKEISIDSHEHDGAETDRALLGINLVRNESRENLVRVLRVSSSSKQLLRPI